jgi:hypothetical protein
MNDGPDIRPPLDVTITERRTATGATPAAVENARRTVVRR